MTAAIDVLIPAYNAARTLRSAVGSIQAQTLADIAIPRGSVPVLGEIRPR